MHGLDAISELFRHNFYLMRPKLVTLPLQRQLMRHANQEPHRQSIILLFELLRNTLLHFHQQRRVQRMRSIHLCLNDELHVEVRELIQSAHDGVLHYYQHHWHLFVRGVEMQLHRAHMFEQHADVVDVVGAHAGLHVSAYSEGEVAKFAFARLHHGTRLDQRHERL